ncbi:hypothetical protein [Williamsia sp. DF01-3]|uniref:hypothetical protein n=1 Tax=Williamsia sp. DF01-3 TaxID=2934157 RepID=UPI001FF47DCB|nr:hypothetical protein [Williamsia sp. DF01-3]MCK0519311.1 hypothetical protein [Williamsia sp. DF01-3]
MGEGDAIKQQGIIGLGGGQVNWRTAVDNTAYTANANHYLIAWTNLTAGRTLTLKDASTLDAGQTYIVADDSGLASTHNITIAPLVGTIKGAANVKLASNYGQLLVWSDCTNWHSSSDLSGKVDVVAGKGLSTNNYTTIEQTKLTGIAAGATQNATDADLRDRTTHTGSQAITTVTGLQAALDGRLSKSLCDTIADAVNYTLARRRGTQFGTATSQRIGFFNATPVVQSTATTDLGTALANVGLRASGSAYPISTSGTGAFTGVHSLTETNVRSGSFETPQLP